MRIGKSSTFRTFSIEWDGDRPRIIVGFFGLDRPSVQWHLTLKWRRLRERLRLARKGAA